MLGLADGVHAGTIYLVVCMLGVASGVHAGSSWWCAYW